MPRLAPYAIGLVGVAVVSWITSAMLPTFGLASSALLFLLPVLLVSARSGTWPGMTTALAGATAYNFFLLPPRLTFQIHGLDNVISVFVLVSVALVTSRLAVRLSTREAEALVRARASAELAELSAVLAKQPAENALERGLAFMERRFGQLWLLEEELLEENQAGLSPLDLAAAAWAFHNGDATGHGTDTMSAAEWTFLPLAPRHGPQTAVAALARPSDGSVRPHSELHHAGQLLHLIGQTRERGLVEAERREHAMIAESDRLRRNLFAALAHDFRTPLTVVTGRLALLAQDNADAGEALVAAQRINRMMDDLLGAAWLEEGSLHPHLESLDAIDSICAALEVVPVPLTVRVDRAIPDDLPFIQADPVLLNHILVNIMDNAQRHARSTVRVSAEEASDALVLAFDDDGPGIPELDRPKVFERFSRIAGGDRKNGSGLGLAIVKGFADAMNMSVAVDAAPSGGARIILSIPMTKSVES